MKKFYIVIILFLAVISFYFLPGIFNIPRMIECVSNSESFLLTPCDPFNSWFLCRRHAYCTISYKDGGKGCNSGSKCSSGICVFKKEDIVRFNKKLIDEIWSMPMLTGEKRLQLPDNFGFCKKYENDQNCISRKYVEINYDQKIVDVGCM